MHIAVNARFGLKGKSKSHKGLSAEYWNFAKDQPLKFPILCAVIVAKLSEFYLVTHPDMPLSKVNEEIQEAARQIATINFAAPGEPGLPGTEYVESTYGQRPAPTGAPRPGSPGYGERWNGGVGGFSEREESMDG